MGSEHELATWFGLIISSIEATALIEAAKRKIVPLITRRLSDSERRKSIRSGSVFVFDAACGMQRWTDHLKWGPSRVSGPFLFYAQLNPTVGDPRDTLIKQSYSFSTSSDSSNAISSSHSSRMHLIAYFSLSSLQHVSQLSTVAEDPRIRPLVLQLELDSDRFSRIDSINNLRSAMTTKESSSAVDVMDVKKRNDLKTLLLTMGAASVSTMAATASSHHSSMGSTINLLRRQQKPRQQRIRQKQPHSTSFFTASSIVLPNNAVSRHTRHPTRRSDFNSSFMEAAPLPLEPVPLRNQSYQRMDMGWRTQGSRQSIAPLVEAVRIDSGRHLTVEHDAAKDVEEGEHEEAYINEYDEDDAGDDDAGDDDFDLASGSTSTSLSSPFPSPSTSHLPRLTTVNRTAFTQLSSRRSSTLSHHSYYRSHSLVHSTSDSRTHSIDSPSPTPSLSDDASSSSAFDSASASDDTESIDSSGRALCCFEDDEETDRRSIRSTTLPPELIVVVFDSTGKEMDKVELLGVRKRERSASDPMRFERVKDSRSRTNGL